MVSKASKNVCKKPTTSTSTQGSTEGSCRKIESICNAEFTANFLLAILNNIKQCPRQQLGQLKQVPAMAGINIECLRHTQLG